MYLYCYIYIIYIVKIVFMMNNFLKVRKLLQYLIIMVENCI